MASWEVRNLDAVVGQARSAGFTVSDAAVGPLPGTRIATIQARLGSAGTWRIRCRSSSPVRCICSQIWRPERSAA